MAVPKRKVSKSRRDKRRAHDFLSRPNWSTCKHCGEPVRPHCVCSACGFYKDRQVRIPKEPV